MNRKSAPHTGGCTCRHVRYTVSAKPLIVHCCHCSWCQRETGTAFALNLVVEASAVETTQGDCELIDTPSSSGNGQTIARCPKCRIALWSNYYQSGPSIRFIRVGTLDEPGAFPPDIHIYTSSKQSWVIIPEGVQTVPGFYDPARVWSRDSLERFANAKASTAN